MEYVLGLVPDERLNVQFIDAVKMKKGSLELVFARYSLKTKSCRLCMADLRGDQSMPWSVSFKSGTSVGDMTPGEWDPTFGDQILCSGLTTSVIFVEVILTV